MTKTSCNLVEGLIRNWYSEYESLNYCNQYPYTIRRNGIAYSVEIFPSRLDFCSSILIEKVVQIANSACVDFHLSSDNGGLVFTLH